MGVCTKGVLRTLNKKLPRIDKGDGHIQLLCSRVCAGKLTTMSAVYSFGVVFLEMITGSRVIDTEKPSSEQHLVNWVKFK